MTPGDFTWYALTTCTALFLLWPMCRATVIVDRTGDASTLACGMVCLGLVVTVIHVLTIDEIVAAVREQYEAEGVDAAQIDEHELTLRMAALVIEGAIEQPENPAPGSVAEIQAPVVEWLRAAAQPWP